MIQLLRYLSFKFINGFLYSFTIVYFYSNSALMDNLYLLIIQEFYFSFFLTFYRINIVGKQKSFSISGLLILLFFVIVSISYSIENFIDGLFLYISSIIFLFYLFVSSVFEKENFSKAIQIENVSSFSSVLFFFIVSLFLHFNNVHWTGLIYLRYCVFFIIVVSYFFTLDSRRKYIENIAINTKTSLNEILSITFILTLMFFKFSVVNLTLLKTEADGIEAKIFLVLYDLIAAIYGYYLRFIISRKKIEKRKGLRYLIFGFISFTLILSFLLSLSLTYSILSREVNFTILLSFMIAGSFGIFVFNEFKSINAFYSLLIAFLILSSNTLSLMWLSIIYFIGILISLLIIDFKYNYNAT